MGRDGGLCPDDGAGRGIGIKGIFDTNSRWNKKTPAQIMLAFSFGDPAGARTQDPHIKSVMLYLLSYRVIGFAGAKVRKKSMQPKK